MSGKQSFAAGLVALVAMALLSGCAMLQEAAGSLGDLAGVASIAGADTRTVRAIQAADIGARTLAGVADAATSPFTAEQEYYVGRAVAANILDQYPVHPDDALTRYVNLVGQSVALFSDRPMLYHGYTFLVLDSEEINALATPGGHIFVTLGMLKLTRSEDELAAVLAHEIAHVVARHGVGNIRTARVIQAVQDGMFEALDTLTPQKLKEATAVFGDTTSDLVDTLVTRGYSGPSEPQADGMAVLMLDRAGYDPFALVRVLTRMDEAQKAQYEGSASPSGFSKTHPKPAARIADLQQSDLKGRAEGSRIDARAAQSRFDARMRRL